MIIKSKLAVLAAWISVLIKRGLEIVKRPKIVGWNWEPSFQELLVNAHHTLSTKSSDHVTIIIVIKSTYRPSWSSGPSNIKLNWYGLMHKQLRNNCHCICLIRVYLMRLTDNSRQECLQY